MQRETVLKILNDIKSVADQVQIEIKEYESPEVAVCRIRGCCQGWIEQIESEFYE